MDLGCAGIVPNPVVQLDFDTVSRCQALQPVARDAHALEVLQCPRTDGLAQIRIAGPSRSDAQDVHPFLGQALEPLWTGYRRLDHQIAVERPDRDDWLVRCDDGLGIS